MRSSDRIELARLGLYPATALKAELSELQMTVFRAALAINMCPAAAYLHATRSPR